jgi:GNAT superfamily N-acetyltransferase
VSNLVIRPEPWASALADELVAELGVDLTERYGAANADEIDHEMVDIDPADVAEPLGAFLVAWLQVDGGDEQAVGCGAIRPSPFPDAAEIKRMYVRPEARGRGISRSLLVALEDRARALGYERLVLETGTQQPEAMALYESEGYRSVAPFGAYRASPLSRCYERSL